MKWYQADAVMDQIFRADCKGVDTYHVFNELDSTNEFLITYNHITKLVVILSKDGKFNTSRVLENTTDIGTQAFRGWIHRQINNSQK
jgi:hypothetical protein